MIVAIKPISSRSGSKHSRWYEQVLKDTAAAFEPRLLSGPLYARVLWFQLQEEGNEPDADNILKKILDALKGIVFQDDREVVRCLAAKTRPTEDGEFLIDVVAVPSTNALAALQIMLGAEQHVLYVEIGPVTDPTVSFGLFR